MSVEIYIPRALSPNRLDRLLASGWFRFSNTLFRSDFLCIDKDISSLVHIRLKLADYNKKKSHRRIIERIDERFTTVISRARMSMEKELLYNMSKKNFKGFVLNHLSEFLMDYSSPPLFETYEVSVYDKDRLIAVSFFDLGRQSMASLLAIYDEGYKKYGLGNYTMYREIEFGLANNYTYYYPGYVLDNNSLFNYKMQIGPVQCRNDNNRWVKLKGEVKENKNTKLIKKRHIEIESLLIKQKIPFKLLLNPFFSLGFISYYPVEFIKAIICIFIPIPGNKSDFYLLEYDWDKKKYFLHHVCRNFEFEGIKGFQDFSYYADDNIYLTDFYIYKSLLFCEETLDPIISWLKKELPRKKPRKKERSKK